MRGPGPGCCSAGRQLAVAIREGGQTAWTSASRRTEYSSSQQMAASQAADACLRSREPCPRGPASRHPLGRHRAEIDLRPGLGVQQVRRRDWHRHGQTFAVEVLEEFGLPREIRVAAGAEPSDRDLTTDAYAPHVVGDPASEPFDASDILTPLVECLPSHLADRCGVASGGQATRNCRARVRKGPMSIAPELTINASPHGQAL